MLECSSKGTYLEWSIPTVAIDCLEEMCSVNFIIQLGYTTASEVSGPVIRLAPIVIHLLEICAQMDTKNRSNMISFQYKCLKRTNLVVIY